MSWFGKVPSHWDTPPVYARYEVQLGKMLDERRITRRFLAPYLRNSDIQWNGINVDDLPEMDFDELEQQLYSLRPGDILMCEGGEIGRCAIWNGGRHCFYQKALHRLRPTTEKDDPRFFVLVMRAAVEAGLFSSQASAATIQHLPAEKLRTVRYPAPPLNEQRAIVEYVTKRAGRIDALLAAKQSLLDVLAEKRQGVIATAVTRGLDPNVRPRDAGVPMLGDIPAHWDVTRLKYVARVQTGIALGKDYGEQPTSEFPYLRVANVQDGFIDLSEVKTIAVPEREAASATLRAGDVLMNEGGDADKLGRGAIWRATIAPCLHQNHVFALRPTSVSPEWLAAWMGSAFAKAFFETRAKQSTNLASISSTNLLELPIAVPPSAEQFAIVEHIARKTAKLDAVRAASERTLALLRERRAALVFAAVTGQLETGATA